MVLDFYHFADLKKWIDQFYDHAMMLNALDPVATDLTNWNKNHIKTLKLIYVQDEPTAENIAMWLHQQATETLLEKTKHAFRIKEVTVYETATCNATYVPPYLSDKARQYITVDFNGVEKRFRALMSTKTRRKVKK